MFFTPKINELPTSIAPDWTTLYVKVFRDEDLSSGDIVSVVVHMNRAADGAPYPQQYDFNVDFLKARVLDELESGIAKAGITERFMQLFQRQLTELQISSRLPLTVKEAFDSFGKIYNCLTKFIR